MKGEPKRRFGSRRRFTWIVDESKCLSAEEVRKLRAHTEKCRKKEIRTGKFTQIRNWFMVELGLEAGLRVEEMAKLKHRDLRVSRNLSSIFVIGKGSKERSVWVSSKLKSKCQTYIRYKTAAGFPVNEDSPLLNNLDGNHITKRSLQKFFKRIVSDAGLPTHHHIHNLRHTYATFLLKASHNNYRFVQEQLGHSSITTTQVYASIIESEGRRALEKLYR